MRKRMSDLGERDIDLRKNVIEVLRRRVRRALFVTEISALLRKANVASASEIERTLSQLAADWAVVIRDHYCADPHLEGVDLRVVALVEPGEGEDAQMRAIHAIDATWHEWLAEYMANHRCS